MCESKLFVLKAGRKEKVMENVARLVFEGDRIVCTDLLGEKKEFRNARLREANLMDHAIVLEQD